LQKNRRFWLTRFIFNKNFLEQSLEVFKLYQLSVDENYEAAKSRDLQAVVQANGQRPTDDVEVMKYIICFTLSVVFRARARDIIPDLVRIIRNALKKNVSLAIWFCEIFSNQEIIKEFLLDCAISDMQRFTSGLLRTAMQTLYKYEEAGIANYLKRIENHSVVGFIQETQASKIIKITEENTKTGQNIDLTQSTPGSAAAQSSKPTSGENVAQ